MYACICRNIKESDYPDYDKLLERLLQDDVVCGSCKENFNKYVANSNGYDYWLKNTPFEELDKVVDTFFNSLKNKHTAT